MCAQGWLADVEADNYGCEDMFKTLRDLLLRCTTKTNGLCQNLLLVQRSMRGKEGKERRPPGWQNQPENSVFQREWQLESLVPRARNERDAEPNRTKVRSPGRVPCRHAGRRTGGGERGPCSSGAAAAARH